MCSAADILLDEGQANEPRQRAPPRCSSYWNIGLIEGIALINNHIFINIYSNLMILVVEKVQISIGVVKRRFDCKDGSAVDYVN